MPQPVRFARIAITLPTKDLAAADRLALRHDRSRSWIVAEAIRRYAAADAGCVADESTVGPSNATTIAALPTKQGLGHSRRAQLIRDLSLTPEARVRAAEETVRLTELRSEPRTHQLIAFDRYEEFLDWKRSQDLRR